MPGRAAQVTWHAIERKGVTVAGMRVPRTSMVSSVPGALTAGETNAMAIGCPRVGLSAPLVISPTGARRRRSTA